jgi:2-C-methyl-D-erythritol 2,4-cyclodiphosphate synthase
VLALVLSRGWRLANVDVTIHAQEPKLSPYKGEMTTAIATTLKIDHEQVNVKAKTGEGVGPIGLGEIIACDAVVLLRGTLFG